MFPIHRRLLCLFPFPDIEDGLQDRQVSGTFKPIPRLLIRVEVCKVVEAGPGDGAEAERAGFVRRQEETVLGSGSFILGDLEELLDGVCFAVPDWTGGFAIGLGEDEGEIGLSEDRGTEELGARGHGGGGDWVDVAVDTGAEGGEEGGGGVDVEGGCHFESWGNTIAHRRRIRGGFLDRRDESACKRGS